jgi:hypothetical protein
MTSMLLTGYPQMDAERAFAREARARRLASIVQRLRRAPVARGLAVYDEPALPHSGLRTVREIPLDAIAGTVEPSRAKLFDRAFRPAPSARSRWQRLWLAEHRGAVLPPISVVRVGDRYAVLDGHHRVSVARARGALTIDAAVEAA